MEQEQEISPSPEYTKGFNEGYMLEKHMPELAKQIKEAISNSEISERSQGLNDGRNQYQYEENEMMPKWLQHKDIKNIFNHEKQSPEAEKDRDVEPDFEP